VLIRHKDDSIQLVIVAASALDGSPQTLKLLERKIRNYLAEIRSPDFQRDYGQFSAHLPRVSVICEHDVDKRAERLIEDIKQELYGGVAQLELVRTFR
jgi:hypothetical protein